MWMQRGFTLVELMIVVVVIAVLAALALPAYQDYVARAQIAEGLSLASQAKAGIVEYYGNHNSWPSSNTDAGIADSGTSIKGRYVTSVSIDDNGVINILYDETTTAEWIRGETLTLTPTASGGSVVWECGGSIDPRYLPSSCRQ